MKKTAVLIFTLFLSGLLNAQLPFNFGPKVGFNTNKLSTNRNEIKESFAANLYTGFFFRFGDRTFIQPELNFATKSGFFSSNNILDVKEIELSTLEIPILIGSEVLNLHAFKFRTMVGTTTSFVLDKEILMRSPDLSIDPDKLKNAIWGLQAGVGVDFLTLTLDFRYEIGLTNISAIEDIEIRNSLFNLSLGWKIF